MKLYEINKELDEILSRYAYMDTDLVDTETGEVLEEEAANEVMASLAQLQMAKEEKRENIACWIKSMDAEIKALKAEEDNLAKRRRSLTNKRDNVFGFLQADLAGEKLVSARVKVTYRHTAAVEVTDMDALPEEYKRVKTTVEADKKAIKDAITTLGADCVSGAVLVERLSMSIK